MTQYINKDALVAEIERRKDVEVDYDESSNSFASYGDETHYFALDSIEDFINTLEVKEVDLEKELVAYHNENLIQCNDGTLLSEETGEELTWYDYKAIAKHFFELGLNTQQNINIDITNIDKVIEENGVDPNSKEAKIFKESYYTALEKLKARKGE